MNLSGRLIDAFLALEDALKFSVAAERCHMSPSAFSQMIGRLEQVVGARLFDRDTRNVALTPEGQAFSLSAHRIADEMTGALAEMTGRSTLARGRLSIAAPPSLAAAWLPKLLASYRREHPGVALRLHDVVSDRCLAMLTSGEVDIGLNAQRGNDLEFESKLLFDEPFFLVCQRQDPLARRKRVRLADLHRRTFVQTLRSGSVWQQTQPLMAGLDAHDTGLEVAQLGTLAGLIDAGFGVSLVPELALQLCTRPGLVSVRIADASAKRPIYLIRRRRRSLSAAAEGMWKLLSQQ